MAYVDGTLTIYSNDGLRIVFESSGDLSLDEFHVVEEGVAGDDISYVYSGNAKFLGLAREPYATVATYGVGDTFVVGQSTAEIFYIVEDTTVANLANTSWYIPSGWMAAAGYGHFSVDCTCDVEGIGAVVPYSLGIGYRVMDETFEPYANRIDAWTNTGAPLNLSSSYGFTLTITGGTDVTNASLIAWLTIYGIQLKVTNLTDTTWYIPSGWNAEAGYGIFNISYTNLDTGVEDTYLCIGYDSYVPKEDTDEMMPYPGSYHIIGGMMFPALNVHSSEGFYIHIAGGADEENPKLIAWLSTYGMQLTIDDLTDTVWYVDKGWSATAGYGQFLVNGTYDGVDLLGFDIGYSGEEGRKAMTDVVSFNAIDYKPSNNFAVSFTGGTDVKNPALIAWLLKYGTQLKVTDLTNTTWNISAGWDTESGYGHFVGIEGYYTTSSESNVSIKGIAIGYDRIEEDAITPTPFASISFGRPEDEYFNVLEDGEPFVLGITGGADVTAPALIAWLSTYGVMQKHPYKFTKLVVGTTASSSEPFAFRRLATAVRLYAPTITETEEDGELLITNNALNGNNVDKWAIYKADGTFVKHVDYTADEQIVRLNFGVQYYVKAVGASGAESPASNLATTKQCFVAGTPVLMADGTYKMIEEIQAGDLVQSYDIETSEFCDGEVTEVVTGYTDRIAMVLFSDGNYVAMAEGHPLYTEDGWHSITNKDGYPTLVVGDKVLGACGFVEIVDLSVVDTEPTMIYSLAVSAKKKRGLYFVGAGISAAHT